MPIIILPNLRVMHLFRSCLSDWRKIILTENVCPLLNSAASVATMDNIKSNQIKSYGTFNQYSPRSTHFQIFCFHPIIQESRFAGLKSKTKRKQHI